MTDDCSSILFPLLGVWVSRMGSSTNHAYNLRSQNEFSIIFRLSSSEEKSIQSRGDKIWRQLPTSIQNSCSLKSFKKCYKKYLIDEMKNEPSS